MRSIIKHLGFLVISLLLVGQGCVSLSDSGPTTSGPAGMFVSTNKGEIWQSVSILPEADGAKNISNVSVYRLFPDPSDAAALYWATRENGYYFSYNEGRTWQQPLQSLMSGFVYSIAVHPEDRCTIYVANGPNVLQSTDCSRSWKDVYRESRVDVNVVTVVFDRFSPDIVLLATSNGDILRSLDKGGSWQVRARLNTLVGEMFGDSLEPDTYYLATRNNGLYRSVDGGTNWVSLQDKMAGFSGSNEFRRFVVDQKNGSLYWVSTYGILVSRDGGDSWRSVDLITPPGSAQIYGFAVNPQNDKEIYYTATINSRSTFYKTEDGGLTWITKKLPSGQLPTVLHVHPEKGDIVYLGFTIPPRQ